MHAWHRRWDVIEPQRSHDSARAAWQVGDACQHPCLPVRSREARGEREEREGEGRTSRRTLHLRRLFPTRRPPLEQRPHAALRLAARPRSGSGSGSSEERLVVPLAAGAPPREGERRGEGFAGVDLRGRGWVFVVPMRGFRIWFLLTMQKERRTRRTRSTWRSGGWPRGL